MASGETVVVTPSFGFRTYAGLLSFVAAVLFLPSAVVLAQPATIPQTVVQVSETRNPQSLVEFWLSVPGVNRVNWSYAFISTDKSNALRLHQRAALISELEIAQTNVAKTDSIAGQLKRWEKALGTIKEFRVPGRWDPAHLIAYPRRIPPVRAVAAAGYCNAVPWVEVWDARGVHRVLWYPGMKASTLISQGELHVFPRTSWLELVLPWGGRKKVGIAPWNFEDQTVIAGTRVIAPLKASDGSTDWLNRALPDFLAHVLPGQACWRSEIAPEAEPKEPNQ